MPSLVIDSNTPNATLNLAMDTLTKNRQALVFVNTRQSAEKTAEDIARKLPHTTPALQTLAHHVRKVLASPTKQCERLSRCVENGIAFHHSGLTQKQKELIETNFRTGVLRIICCTPTLAAGVDLPAYRAIIRDLRRYGARGLNWIPVLEYLQMCGRAGRPSFDTEGQAIAVAATEAERDEIHERYILGEPESIHSKLAVEPVLRTYVLSLTATGFVRTRADLVSFFSRTFWAHQFGDMERLGDVIDKMLLLLTDWEFLAGSSDFIAADSLGDDRRLRATPLGRRVAELYLDPLTAHHIITGLRKVASWQDIPPFSLLQLLSWTLEMRPLLRVRVKESEDMEASLTTHAQQLLTAEPSAFEESFASFLDSVKTALFFSAWIDERGEDTLLERFSIRPGEIRVKLDTLDWLLYAAEELCTLLNYRVALRSVTKLRMRARHGVREELLPLLRLRGIGRVRARRLFSNRLRDLGDVKNADITTLTQVLGSGKLAIEVKQQLGETITKVPRRARKGQMSMAKY